MAQTGEAAFSPGMVQTGEAAYSPGMAHSPGMVQKGGYCEKQVQAARESACCRSKCRLQEQMVPIATRTTASKSNRYSTGSVAIL